jgi:hypothetical protein
MTANSASLVAESASSTIDSEVQASRASDAVLSAGFQSGLTIDEDAVDEPLTRQLLAEASRRSDRIDSLLEGRAFGEWGLREVAGCLRLPIIGPFVVVAAEVPAGGDEPLPEIESKLRSLDIFSAWRLLPDLQVGVVHAASDQNSTRLSRWCPE